ncbi:MAG: hypothetical protein JRF57_13975 [Deltaproteobacteria bacterium]|nr:hypothetical protein [Deltaproteobacteria bacterium]
MIERHKKEFTELLRKIESINIDQSANHDDMGSLFRVIEDDYRKIQRSLAAKREDLKIISDILGHSYSSNDTATYNQLKSATDKVIRNLNNYAFFGMKERLIPFNFEKGNWLFSRGRIKEALDSWEEVLRVNPDNEYVHSMLLETINIPHATKSRAVDLNNKYRFKYMGSFGQDVLKGPIAIVADDYDDTLFVSDNMENKIHKFNVQGEYLGPLLVEVKNSRGLFKDTEGNLWICDFGNSRLLAVDSTDSVVGEIRLQEILGDKFVSIYPVFGYLNGDRFYLLLVNASFRQRMLVSFNRYNPHDSLDILPIGVLQTPNFFGFLDNQLYVCDLTQCDLFIFDASQRLFRPIGFSGIPYPLRWLVDFHDGFFLSAGMHILKVSSNGQIIFSANISSIFGIHKTLPFDLAIFREQNTQILFVTDYSLACIHMFAI